MEIELRGLTREFNHTRVVDNINFSIAPGDLIGYLGPNGAGKSTTVKMLAGLLEPSAGAILFNGTNIEDNPFAYRARLGYVPEDAHLYTYLTGEEYLLMVGRLHQLSTRITREKLHRLAELLRLQEVDLYLPIRNYSKGMTQKVLIIATLMHHPELLILDEPFSGLDVTVSAILRRFLFRFCARGGCVLFSTHILDLVERICRRIIIIHHGRIVADSPKDELKAVRRDRSVEAVFHRLVDHVDVERIAGEMLACALA